MVGPWTGAERLIVATGGYKIGLGIAHLIGDSVATMIRGEPSCHPLPPEFTPDRHLTRSPVTRSPVSREMP
jgi:glycine/D-amino acid oxidase-like deaminating enzyme